MAEKWRILVFMSTESESLVEAAKADMAELLLCADTTGLEIRLQVHGYLLDGSEAKDVARYTIASGVLSRQPSPVTAPQPPDETAFAEFLAWGLTGADEKTARAIVFWGHAQGVGDRIPPPGSPPPPPGASPASLSAGSQFHTSGMARKAINPPPTDLRDALASERGKASTRQPDLFVFDSCFMASAEIAAHFQGTTAYLLASQTNVARPALNLTDLLRAAQRIDPDPASDPGRRLGMALLDQANASAEFVRSLSLFKPDVKIIEPMKAFVAGLKKATSAARRSRRVQEIFLDVAFYGVRQFLDLPELAHRLAEADPVLHPAADALAQALAPAENGFLVARRPEPRDGGPHGMSIHCPWIRPTRSEIDEGALDVVVLEDDYREFELARESGWLDFAFGLFDTWAVAQNRCEPCAGEDSGCTCHVEQPCRHHRKSRESKPHDLSFDPDKPHDLSHDAAGANERPARGGARRRH
jgi:hypothetical protein